MNRKMPLVSVELLCYNHEKYVGEAIESILNQTYENIELIVADNGSTDHSYDVICGYRDRISKLIRLEKNDMRLCSDIIDENCTGDYIAVATSDDYWEPEKIELQVRAMLENPDVQASATWALSADEEMNVVPGTQMFRASNRSREDWLRQLILDRNCLPWPSALLKRECYYGMYSRGYRQTGDVLCWIQALFMGELYVVERDLVKLRFHPNGANRNEGAASRETITRLWNEKSDMLEYIIEDMPDELFVKVFQEYLVNPMVEKSEEIACEKLFVLQKLAAMNSNFYYASLHYYYRHLSYRFLEYKDSFGDVLNRVYHYSNFDFSQWSGMFCPSQLESDCREQLNFLQGKLEEKDKKIAALKKSLFDRMEGEECTIPRELFRGLTLSAKKDFREIEKLLETNVDRIKEISIADGPAYEELIPSLMEMDEKIDALWEELEYLECSADSDDWANYKELIRIASQQPVDLTESVLLFLEDLMGKIHRVRLTGQKR